MKKTFFLLLSVVLLAACHKPAATPESSGITELDEWTQQVLNSRRYDIGYPVNLTGPMDEFYKWFVASGLHTMHINNAGDPFGEPAPMSCHKFEREVIEWFAPLYGFDQDNLWGIVTNSGTDGNNHGIYFGANYLYKQTGKRPVLYVSDEAHYSNLRLADLQNLDVRLVKTDTMGRMIPAELEKVLDTTRPCLIVYAMGSTFKGAIDDQAALNAVLARHPQMPVFRHVDAALFGGYIPFTEYKDLVSRKVIDYESVAISGHKFFGIDEPAGLFLTTREVYDNQANFDIPYLNANMKMINCSRSGLDALKFWWLIHKVGKDGWTKQADCILEQTAYLNAELTRIGWPHWSNPMSNTIIMRRPSDEMLNKWVFACGHDDALGGDLVHVVVMQHVTHDVIDELIRDLQQQ